MRAQALLRPTRSLLKRRASSQCALFSHTHTTKYPRKGPATTRAASQTHKRSSSSATPPTPTSDAGTEPTPASAPAVPPEEPEDGGEKPEAEKPRRRKPPSARAAEAGDAAPPTLPAGLDILWTPGVDEVPPTSTLPPPDILQEALNNLLITLHPQTQHRATYALAGSPLVEPTLALYCPMEGGDFIVDETVREMARRTNADVVVLDAVQLAAGEWGAFGKPAAALQLPQNPLHFPSAYSRSSTPLSQAMEEDEIDDENDFSQGVQPSQMTLHVMAHGVPVRNGRQSFLSSSSRSSPSAKMKVFFDELINVAPIPEPEGTPSSSRRPRLIYIRDYPTLAASASTWYPPLLAAVRQRRQGPMSRPSSPITNSMTIVFGITPPMIPAPGTYSTGGPQTLMGLIMSRSGGMVSGLTRPGGARSEHGEDSLADKSRERRLRERLRKWERGDPAWQNDLPSPPHASPDASSGTPGGRAGIVILGPSGLGGMGGLPPGLASALQARAGHEDGEGDGPSQFFRSAVLVPAVRSVAQERACRVARRREINELTMRMGVGAVGGALGDVLPSQAAYDEPDAEIVAEDGAVAGDDPAHSDAARMWHEWGVHVEAWPTVKDIADRAVGSVVASGAIDVTSTSRSSLEPTPISWSAVVSAWAAQRSSRDVRKTWIQASSGGAARDQHDEDEVREKAEQEKVEQLDEVVQAVKQDPDLTPHEQRLLGCIVDAGSMPTSFSQVHLPPHTIDSVRTIVSLPLLHPSAFQQGILKQHSMTGCLLFGPPGTGKTLVVRALAKEAGCRMMTVSPSDVMDMYVGEGEKLVRSLFSLARRLSPCVIFLDEIDALFGARMSARETGGAIAHRGVITEFMQEMDGLKTNKDTNVIVIGATNRPFDLDDAVLRRLPRRLLVDLPGEKERAAILKILLRDEKLADDIDLVSLAKRTDLFSGSDLKHLCVSAALAAVKEYVSVPWEVPDATAHLPASATSSNVQDSSNGVMTTPASQTSNSASPSRAFEASVSSEPESASTPDPGSQPRVLNLHHFDKALKEITPSSSEALGSLSALRKWNDEFGEGQKKKRKAMWGKGLFGFAESAEPVVREGQVSGRDFNAMSGHEGRVR